MCFPFEMGCTVYSTKDISEKPQTKAVTAVLGTMKRLGGKEFPIEFSL